MKALNKYIIVKSLEPKENKTQSGFYIAEDTEYPLRHYEVVDNGNSETLKIGDKVWLTQNTPIKSDNFSKELEIVKEEYIVVKDEECNQ